MRHITDEYAKGDAYLLGRVTYGSGRAVRNRRPFVMGTGRRFFPEGTPPTKLELVEGRALDCGSLAVVYRPAGK